MRLANLFTAATIIPCVTEMTLHWGHHHNLIGHLRLVLHTPVTSVKSIIATKSNGDGVVVIVLIAIAVCSLLILPVHVTF